ncbi:MAG TPA: hypothetical protein VIR16_06215 [Candidatus Limnocylindrales bacterium]
MTPRPLRGLTRDAEAPMLFESFFVAAVASFLGIRWFLAAAGYPRVGSGGIHIAHMLWGGALMLLALLLLLAFLDRSVTHAAAVIAGLGFGTFIDEIGKFVTADNNYFFRPAIALIYGVFVVAFLLARVLVGQRRLTPDEALRNALAHMAGTPTRGIEPDDRARVAELLRQADPADPRTGLARQYLAAVPSVAEHDSPIEIIVARVNALYERVMATPAADPVLVGGMAVYAILAIVGVVVVVALGRSSESSDAAAVATVAQIGSSLVGAALIGRGIVALSTSRIAAYHWFLRGLLVWILVTQVFVFYTTQLGGLGGLVIDLGAYWSIRYAIGRERLGLQRSSGLLGEGA